ncbi:MAG: hypothetical protein ABSA51_08565 [Anaerolineaceae bacterium]
MPGPWAGQCTSAKAGVPSWTATRGTACSRNAARNVPGLPWDAGLPGKIIWLGRGIASPLQKMVRPYRDCHEVWKNATPLAMTVR